MKHFLGNSPSRQGFQQLHSHVLSCFSPPWATRHVHSLVNSATMLDLPVLHLNGKKKTQMSIYRKKQVYQEVHCFHSAGLFNATRFSNCAPAGNHDTCSMYTYPFKPKELPISIGRTILFQIYGCWVVFFILVIFL